MGGMRSSVATVVIGFGLAVGYLYAQTDTSTITGQITERSGAALSGTIVTLTSPSTNSTCNSVSRATVVCIFQGILPGTYRFEFRAEDFRKPEKNQIHALDNSKTVCSSNHGMSSEGSD